DPPHVADAGVAREAGGGRGGVGVRPLHRGRLGAAARRAGRAHAPERVARPRARDARRARAARPRDALRPERRSAAHARRGRARVQRHARADPADREPVAQEAALARRGAEAARGGLSAAALRPGSGGGPAGASYAVKRLGNWSTIPWLSVCDIIRISASTRS